MRRSLDPTKFLVLFLALPLIFAAKPMAAPAQLSTSDILSTITALLAPPAIPAYVQPPAPAPNYIWTPGYWAYANGGYYWVPGTWVPAPSPGLLWTPGYWAADNNTYVWNQGYWAPQVGYYGGVDYGYGYYGRKYVGGRWDGDRFRYNTAVTNVNQTVIQNVYVDRTVVVNHWNHVSYNGGRGGLTARPTDNELAERRGRHEFATSVQVQHQRIAAENRESFLSVNHGRPAIAAVARPFSERNRPEGRTAAFRTESVHTAVRSESQHRSPQYAQPQHAASQHMAPQHAQYAAPHAVSHVARQHAAPQYAAPQHAFSHIAPQRASPQYAVPRHIAPQRALPQQAPRQNGAPQNLAPQRAAPARDQGQDKRGGPSH